MADAYARLIAAEVARDEADFKEFRARALSIISVAGGLVSLSTGLLAIAAGSRKDILPSGAGWLLSAALGAYVTACVLALRVNRPVLIDRPDESSLGELADAGWNDEDSDAEQSVAAVYVKYIASLRASNEHSATTLREAITAEATGVALTAVTAMLILWNIA
jgi:hypothetical protein